MTESLTTALERSAQPKEARTVLDLLERQRPEIEKLLQGVVTSERFTRVTMTELRRNPKLYECDPLSVIGAVMLAAQLGLEPGPLGHAYLVPFKRECTFILGYKGMVELAHRSGQVKEIVARSVYTADEWDYWTTETGDHYRHVPLLEGDRGEPRLWYARVRLKSGGNLVQPVTVADVERARARSANGKHPQSPWVTDFDAMARKTAIRRLAPFLPQTPAFAQALEADDAPVEPPAELEGDGQA